MLLFTLIGLFGGVTMAPLGLLPTAPIVGLIGVTVTPDGFGFFRTKLRDDIVGFRIFGIGELGFAVLVSMALGDARA